MGLREQAAVDLKRFVEDTDGFAWPITITDPTGTSLSMTGLSNDIHQAIDPQTGMLVSGRSAHVTLIQSTLCDAGLDRPIGIASGSGKPWVVVFDDVQGETYKFAIREALPDRTVGIVVCRLEFFKT